MLKRKLDFGERLGVSRRATDFQSERQARARQLANLSLVLLFSAVFISPVDEALADIPVAAGQSDSYTAEVTNTWTQDVVGRIGYSDGFARETLLAPGEQFILVQSGEPKVCTIFSTREANRVSDACLDSYREYKGKPYKIKCGHSTNDDDRLILIAEKKWIAYRNACGCSNQCKPGDKRN